MQQATKPLPPDPPISRLITAPARSGQGRSPQRRRTPYQAASPCNRTNEHFNRTFFASGLWQAAAPKKSDVELSSPATILSKRDIESTCSPQREWRPSREQWFVMVSLSVISFVVSLDATILVTALPEISRSLHGSAAETFWTGTSYLLTSAVVQPVVAAASNCYGRQPLLAASVVIFTGGTVLCAAAGSFGIMLAGRCLQGIGGGGIIAMTQAIFCDMIPLRQQPKYFSMVLGSWSIGSIVGPVVGGALVEHASWRWCFHVNYPFCGVGLTAVALFIYLESRVTACSRRLPSQPQTKRMDWTGAGLFVGATTSLLLGVSWGGVQYAWTSAETLAPIVAGVLGAGTFVSWQMHARPHSLLPTALFRDKSLVAALYCALVNGYILYSALYYVPFYDMSIRGAAPVTAGINLFPAVCLLVPGAVVVALLTSRLGRFRWAIWIGWIVTLIACSLLVFFDQHQRTSRVLFAAVLACFGIGNGMLLTGINVGTQALSKAGDRAMAGCMYGFMRSLGMPIGVAVSGTVFQNVMSGALTDAGLSASIAKDSERFVHVLQTMDNSDLEKIAILQSYMQGFRAVFVTMAVMSLTALLASCFIKSSSMDEGPSAGSSPMNLDSPPSVAGLRRSGCA